MKNLFILFCFFSTISYTQVESVDFLMKYNCETNQYDVKLVILEGEATSIPQRAQFNSQISVVVPTGENLVVTDHIMPIQNNQFYDGDTPLLWTVGTPEISPAIQPENDFYGITPTLSPASFYHDLQAGDVVTLFSITVGESGQYDESVRFFKNGVDPDESNMGGGDFSNGFTMGGAQQLFNDSYEESCITSIEEEENVLLSVFPNPFQNELTIESNEVILNVKLIGVDGKIYHEKESVSSKSIHIKTEELPTGLYYILIQSETTLSTKNIIKN